MLTYSLGRLTDAIAHVLRDEALPAIADASVRANVSAAIVLLGVIERRAEWKAESACLEQSCRADAMRALPPLLAGTPFADMLGRPPLQREGTAQEESARMDDFVARLIAALDADALATPAQVQPLRDWAMAYCMATVLVAGDDSTASTVGEVTRR